MGFSESESCCRKHPNTRQIPGVCSSCLREKLSQLNTTPYNRTTPLTLPSSPSLPSSSPPYSSASSSSATARKSPPNGGGCASIRKGHRRNGSSEMMDSTSNYVSVGFILNDGKSFGLKKSRSVACAPRSSIGGCESRRDDGGGDLTRSNVSCRGRKKEGKTTGDKWKSGFWSRLVHSSGRKAKGVLMHSNSTMNERSGKL